MIPAPPQLASSCWCKCRCREFLLLSTNARTKSYLRSTAFVTGCQATLGPSSRSTDASDRRRAYHNHHHHHPIVVLILWAQASYETICIPSVPVCEPNSHVATVPGIATRRPWNAINNQSHDAEDSVDPVVFAALMSNSVNLTLGQQEPPKSDRTPRPWASRPSKF